eukprot:TRINITY_DN3037_c0_g1_i1.p1 TRINITY_DN3037_c0_g1~~TRINITY_DN3037_c0_g1_i1.p1  ORF type:complete len:378 (-),score=104.75 TRINITY_DN3037_c0_g1_i1:151-1284(-)
MKQLQRKRLKLKRTIRPLLPSPAEKKRTVTPTNLATNSTSTTTTTTSGTSTEATNTTATTAKTAATTTNATTTATTATTTTTTTTTTSTPSTPASDSAESSENESKLYDEVEEMISQLESFKSVLGGETKIFSFAEDKAKHKQGKGSSTSRHLSIEKKVTRREFLENYTDFEYIFLQILGFKEIQKNKEQIMQLNNNLFFSRNPGVQFLERVAGMTMHGDRPGANSIIKSALPTLVAAYQKSKEKKDVLSFFETGFDRTADPCLEGRIQRLQSYLEANSSLSPSDLPVDEFSLDFQNKEDKNSIIGEYLRVFRNSQLNEFAKDLQLPYPEAKQRWEANKLPGFEKFYNAKKFEKYLMDNKAGLDSFEKNSKNFFFKT